MNKWNIGWGTISKCNMKCQFCYSEHRRKLTDELAYDDWIKFIDENHDKIATINYGTGENTLSDNWFRLVYYIHSHYPEIRQALTTNGYLSEAIKKKENLQIFAEAIDEIDVSLDYYKPQLHNEFRGQSNAWGWAINTLKLCKEYHKPSTIVFLGSKKNLYPENIDGLFEIATKYGAILRMNMYRPTEGINDFSKQFIVSYETFMNTIKYISETQSIIAMNDALFSSFLTDKTIHDPSGERSIRILADGSITPSTYLIGKDYIVANITEDNVLEKLENESLLCGIIDKVIPKECNDCIYADSCSGGVYDRRYLWYGTLEKRDPYCPHVFTRPETCNISITQTDFKSVHDGYLPTIFFKPREKK